MRHLGDATTLNTIFSAMNTAMTAPRTAAPQTGATPAGEQTGDSRSVSINIPWIPIVLTFLGIVGGFFLLRKKK